MKYDPSNRESIRGDTFLIKDEGSGNRDYSMTSQDYTGVLDT